MRPHSIRWKPHTPLAAKRACAEWLRGKGYMPIPLIGDHWLVRREWQ
jgi:hypothetical protein